MFMTQKCFSVIKYRINYLQLSNSREYIFSTYFRIQPDVAYHDLMFYTFTGKYTRVKPKIITNKEKLTNDAKMWYHEALPC